jgi:hypothetical protein
MSRAELAKLFRGQAGWCKKLGSPIYATLLERAGDDLDAGGPVWRVVEPYADRPVNFTHHLRLMAATHKLALAGHAPELAAHYPSTDGDGDIESAWEAFMALLQERPISLDHAVQTNEVGRSAALLGGFLTIAEETGLGLRVLELGASAGLNLRWDRFRYEAPDWAWGDASSPLTIRAEYDGGRPPLAPTVWVVERAGCDRDPIDPTTDDGALTLQSFVWPEQLERLDVLRAAIEVARRTPATVERASAPDWLADRLAEERGGAATVVYHSVVWGYLTDEDRTRITDLMHTAGEQAAEANPLAWLRMEPGPEDADLTLTIWPGGEERVLASAGYHGRPVRWSPSPNS